MQGGMKSGSKRRNSQRKSGSGKEVSSRTPHRRSFRMMTWESEKAPKLVYARRRFQEVMWPPTAPCWVPVGSGEHVVGQWRSWIMMRRWGRCMVMYGKMMTRIQILEGGRVLSQRGRELEN